MEDFSWAPPPLAVEDERLIFLYKDAGRPLDDLPYTEEFEKLVEKYGGDGSREARHDVFRRLIRLRKQGRLPRVVGKFQ